MYVSNEDQDGFLINTDDYDEALQSRKLHTEMWQIFNNREVSQLTSNQLTSNFIMIIVIVIDTYCYCCLIIVIDTLEIFLHFKKM